jgi:cysteine synthase
MKDLADASSDTCPSQRQHSRMIAVVAFSAQDRMLAGESSGQAFYAAIKTRSNASRMTHKPAKCR